MADDTPEVDVAMPNVRMMPPIHKGNAAEKARKKAEIEREMRTERQRAARLKAKMVFGDSGEMAEEAAASKALSHMSIEDLAEKAVRRMANIVLLGGEAFAPASLREASEAATAWANIAFKEAQKRKAMNTPDEDELTPAEAAAKAMRQLKTQLSKQSKAG